MRILSFFLVFVFFAFTHVNAQSTYTIGRTEYVSGEYYTNGKPMVKRSSSNKKEFLTSRGYTKTPSGYEIDHIVPLSQGGTDSPNNMQLLTVDQHKAKTARERARYSTNYTSNTYKAPKYYSTSTYKASPAIRTYSVPSAPRYSSPLMNTYKIPSPPMYTAPVYNSPALSFPTSGSGKALHTGSRGGTYYINSNGNKTYVKN